MKENPNIDELLNSFIDGELTTRQLTEVQRLMVHDGRIAQRLWELQKCKMLVSSLPCAKAPAEMAGDIQTSLERRTLLGQQQKHFDERKGARHLLVRKVLAAAAMIGLAAGLLAVVYTILAPQSGTEKPIAIEDWQQPAREIEARSSQPSIAVIAEESMSQPVGFNARLELKTSVLAAVNAFIRRAIEDNGLLDCSSSKAEGGKSIYVLSCSRQALSLLLADLENVWEKFDSATLFVETDQFGDKVVVTQVSAEQIAEIANQDSLERRIKIAKDFAVLNNMVEFLPGKEVFAVIDDRGENLITIPKPVLTSAVRRPVESEKTIKKPAHAAREQQEHLTIVVAGSE